MPRAKANFMTSAINSYLKRRRYPDTELNSKHEHSLSVYSLHQMAVMSTVDKELARNNSILFSNNVTSDSRQVEHQFIRLKNWIADLKGDGYRCELEALLCPLFCHLYLEMLCGNHRQSASKFFERHQALFSSRENSRKFLEELACVISSQDIKVNTFIKLFRSSKYHLQLSQESLTMLQRYLSEHGHLLILQTLQKWFDLELILIKKISKEVETVSNRSFKCIVKEEPGCNLKSREDKEVLNHFFGKVNKGFEGEPRKHIKIEKEDPDFTQHFKNVPKAIELTCINIKQEKTEDNFSNACPGEEPFIHRLKEEKIDDSKAKILEIIRNVNEKPSSNPLLHYVISNVIHNSRVSGAKINESVSLLGAGVNNSIRLWGLSHKLKCHTKFSSVNLRTPISQHYFHSEPRCQEKCSVILHGHTGPVQDIAFVPSSTFHGVLVSVSQDTTMRSWRLDTHENVAAYRGHNHEIWCVDVSSLGIYIATGSRDRTARVWTLDRNFPLRTCAGHHLDVECIEFHPNNMYFATGSADKTVKMWSVNEAKLLRLFFGHADAITAIAFSPDGKFLASAADDRIKIWDLAAGKLFRENEGHTGSIVSLAWDKSNEYLSSGSVDGTVRLWSMKNKGDSSENQSSNLLRTHFIDKGVCSVQYSKSNTLVCVSVK